MMSDNLEMEQPQEGSDLLTLIDDDGVEHQFEVADDAEFEGHSYVALIPVHGNPADVLDDTGELVILRVVEDEDEEEDALESIEDEEEFERVSAFFMERLGEFFEFE